MSDTTQTAAAAPAARPDPTTLSSSKIQLHPAFKLPRRGGAPVQLDGPHRPQAQRLRIKRGDQVLVDQIVPVGVVRLKLRLPATHRRESPWIVALVWIALLLGFALFWHVLFTWVRGMHG